ncbi:integrase, catalytic region, zinc finger, CCHC-type containing protein [Tanacetum coccineum]|uniref:Integrase, catalytic region, zinc finger, CCHC-type containing protein n=1 Tax=Tanacetum coccineum TaxID=301880 RepID=A0ABQ5BRL6_9ASTR
MDEIKTINNELEHSVAKLLSENERLHEEIEHLKNQFDSIKKTHVLSKEHCNHVLDNATTITNATTIAPVMFKLDIEPLSHRLKNNRDAYEDYQQKTIENTNTIRGLVERAKKQNPSEPLLDSAFMFTKHVHELSQPTCNKKNDRISQKPSSNRKNKVEAQHRKVNKKNRVKDPIYDANVKHTMLNANSELIYVKCNQCMFDANHDVCFLDFVNDVNVRSKSKSAKKSQHHNIWKPTDVPSSSSLVNDRLSRLIPGNDQIAKIIGYDDYQLGNVIISRVYYVEGLGHNLFSVRLFCDTDLEVAFRKNTCFIRNLEGVDVLSGSRGTNLYTISLNDMLKTSPICLLSKASKTKSWLWHHWLSHLKFSTLNKLAKDGLARGIPKLKFQKDHLCSACALGKSKKSSHHPKAEDTN